MQQIYKNLTSFQLNIVDLGISFKPKGSATGDVVNLLDYKKAEEIEKSEDLKAAIRKGLISVLEPVRRVVHKPLKVQTVAPKTPDFTESNPANFCKQILATSNQQCKRRPLKDQDYCSSHALREEINLDV